MPKPIAIEAVIIGSVHLCRSEKSERKRNAGIAQVIYLATLIGQSIGANDMKKADEFAKILFIVNTIFIACLCIPIFIFARQIMTLFTPSAETIALGDIALKITAATEVLFSLTVVMGGICRGSGDVKFPLFL